MTNRVRFFWSEREKRQQAYRCDEWIARVSHDTTCMHWALATCSWVPSRCHNWLSRGYSVPDMVADLHKRLIPVISGYGDIISYGTGSQ
jgi:hypothetical protein